MELASYFFVAVFFELILLDFDQMGLEGLFRDETTRKTGRVERSKRAAADPFQPFLAVAEHRYAAHTRGPV